MFFTAGGSSVRGDDGVAGVVVVGFSATKEKTNKNNRFFLKKKPKRI